MMRSARRPVGLVSVAFAILCAGAAEALPLHAQVERCRIEAPLGYERPLTALAKEAERILPALEEDLGVRPRATYRILMIPPGPLSDPELVRLSEAAPPWAAGFMVPGQRVGAIRLANAESYPYGSVASVLAHEATHQLLHDAVDGRLPHWFEEATAMWEERRWSVVDAAVLSTALMGRDVPELDQWDGLFEGGADDARLAYSSSFAFVAWASRHGEPGLVRRLVQETERRPFSEAWRLVTAEPLASSHAQWRAQSVTRYKWIGLIAGASPLWVGITLLALLAGLWRRRRTQAIRRRWLEEEQRAREIGP